MKSHTPYIDGIHFPALTGFRALAAWLVFAHHYNPFTPGFLSDVVNNAHIGVSMFFVLSGFLITIRYDHTQFSFGDYMRKRMARIYPLYFLLTTLTFFVMGEWGWIYIANITFLKGFSDELKFTGISQGWSLTVEETFYLLAPLIFLAMRRTRLLSNAVIPARSVGIPWIACCISLILALAVSSNNFLLTYTFLGRAFDFFIGIFIARIYQRKIAFRYVTWIGVLGIVLCLTVLQSFFAPIATGLLLFGLLNENTWLQRVLSTRPMQLLGKSSYAFYLVHIGVIGSWLSDIISSNALILFVLLNAVSIALYYTVERPLHQYFLPKNERIPA